MAVARVERECSESDYTGAEVCYRHPDGALGLAVVAISVALAILVMLVLRLVEARR